MRKYEKPILTVISVKSEDVITLSVQETNLTESAMKSINYSEY